MTVYKRRARALSLEQLERIRYWLRRDYLQCLDAGDQSGAEEIKALGMEVTHTIDSIKYVLSTTDAEVVEY